MFTEIITVRWQHLTSSNLLVVLNQHYKLYHVCEELDDDFLYDLQE